MIGVPFFPNPDDTHCYQCCLKMVLNYFYPNREYSWNDLDKLTGKRSWKWTWSLLGMIQMQKQGFDVRYWDPFDYQKFADKGEMYLIERYGLKDASILIFHSDIPYERKVAATYAPYINQTQPPDFSHIKSLLREGFLLVCGINLNALNEKPGYAGHFVLVYGFEGQMVHLHDPGPPAAAGRTVPQFIFDKAWSYPTVNDRSILAFRPKALKSPVQQEFKGLKQYPYS